MTAIYLTTTPPADIAIALANAERDPDGQVFPWVGEYPLNGSTVVCEGMLWTVASCESGPAAHEPIAVRVLVGQGHDSVLIAARCDCRPVTWTAELEAQYEASLE